MGLLTQEIIDFVNRTKLGFIATVCPDGTPNLSPKGTTIAWDDDHLAFVDICSPGTINNLKVNPAIEVNVVDVFARRGYRFKGIAKIFSDGPMFSEVISYYGEAASKYQINNVVLVKVDRVFAISSPVYDTGLSENEITNKWIEYWKSIHIR